MQTNKFIVQCVMEDLILPRTPTLDECFRASGATVDQMTGDEVLTAGGSADLTVEAPELRGARIRALAHFPSLCARMGDKWVAAEATAYLERCVAEDDTELSIAVAGILATLGETTKFRAASFTVDQQCRILHLLLGASAATVRERAVGSVVPAIFGAASHAVPVTTGARASRARLRHAAELLSLIRGLVSSEWSAHRASGAQLIGFVVEHVADWILDPSTTAAARCHACFDEQAELLDEACKIFRMHFLGHQAAGAAALRFSPALEPLELAAAMRTLPSLVDTSTEGLATGLESSHHADPAAAHDRLRSIPLQSRTNDRLSCAAQLLPYSAAVCIFGHCVASGIGGGMDRQRRVDPKQRAFKNACVVDDGVLRALSNLAVELVMLPANALLLARCRETRERNTPGSKATGPRFAEALLVAAQEGIVRPFLSIAAADHPQASSRSSDWQARWLVASVLAPLSDAVLHLTAEAVERQSLTDDGGDPAALLHHLRFYANVMLKKGVAALASDDEEEVRIAAVDAMGRLLDPLAHSHTTEYFGAAAAPSEKAASVGGAAFASAIRWRGFDGPAAKRRLATLADTLLAQRVHAAAASRAAGESHAGDIIGFLLDASQLGIMDTCERMRAGTAAVMASIARTVASWNPVLQTLTLRLVGGAPSDGAAAVAGFAAEQEQLLRIMADLLHDESYLVQLDAISVIADFLDAFGADVVASKLVALTEKLLRNPLWRIRATLGIVLPNLLMEFLRIAFTPPVSAHAIAAKRFIAEKLVPLFVHVLFDQVQAVRDVALANLQERVLTLDASVSGPFLNDLLWPSIVNSSLATRTYIMRVAVVHAAVTLADPQPVDAPSLTGASAKKKSRQASASLMSWLRSPTASAARDSRSSSPALGGAAAGGGRSVSPARGDDQHAGSSPAAAAITPLDLERHALPVIEAAASDKIVNVRMRAARALWQLLRPGKEVLGYSAMRVDPIATTREASTPQSVGTAPGAVVALTAATATSAQGRKTILTKAQRDRFVLPLLRRLVDDTDADVREIAASAIAHCT